MHDDELDGVRAPEVAGGDVKRVDAWLRVPPSKWQKDRANSISKETIQQCVAHLGDFDDGHLAETSVGMLDSAHDSAERQAIVVTRLARVRRLLDEGATDPDQIVPIIRHTLREAIDAWPKAYEDRRTKMTASGGALSLDGPDEYECLRVQALASTYLLTELHDYSALPMLARLYRLHDGFPRKRSPVPPGFILYAMHELTTNYAEAALTAQASLARKTYLHAAEGLFPSPTTETVTKSWKTAYDESDPRIMIKDHGGLVLAGQKRMNIRIYPTIFRDGTPISDNNGSIAGKATELFAKLETFAKLVDNAK